MPLLRLRSSLAHYISGPRLAARASAVSTGSPVLDRLLTGPGFLDAGAFPEIIFRSELLASVPAGWRAVGRLRVKRTEYELACQLDLDLPGARPGGPPRIIIASGWVIDSRWVTTRWVPALGRRIVMTCSFPSNRRYEQRPGIIRRPPVRLARRWLRPGPGGFSRMPLQRPVSPNPAPRRRRSSSGLCGRSGSGHGIVWPGGEPAGPDLRRVATRQMPGR